MVHVINKIEQGSDYHWAGLISTMIDKQLRDVLETKRFTMSSYVMYVLARFYPYRGLSPQGTFGQDIVYEVYPELHLGHKNYKRVNDAFTMHITRML